MSTELEAERQAALLASLRGPQGLPPVGARGLPGPSGRGNAVAGVQAYRANALATAWRALGAAYPTLSALVGEEAMRALARDLWWHCPPARGDLAHWGADLAVLIGRIDAYADDPYLADVARLDWAVHRAGCAADSVDGVSGLERLADTDPQRLYAEFAPGAALVDSVHPIVSLWQAHSVTGPVAGLTQAQALAAAAQALRAGRPECAWVWRAGWAVQVDRLDPADVRFTASLLAGASLAQALEAGMAVPAPAESRAGDTRDAPFAFDQWLVRALRASWLQSWRVVSA